jgi:hypothetical protein
MTWDAHTIVAVPAARPDVLRDTIDDMTDGFVADWRAVR